VVGCFSGAGSTREEMADLAEDIAEAKRLLGSATRPAVKAVLAKFISETTAAELEALQQMEDAPELEASEPKTAAVEAADLLEPAPLKQRDENSMEVDAAITAPPPTKLGGRGAQHAPTHSAEWITPSYGWEQGEYNTPWVNVMVSIEGVGAVKDTVACDFGQDSFDLRVVGAQGKNYRLVMEALEKDIVPDESKIVVKKNRVTVKLKKIKGEYSYDHWNDLKKKGGRVAKEKEKSRDPTAGIMDLMKDLYDNGDDNMRRIIGESMMKSRNGEKVDPDDISKGIGSDPKMPAMPDLDLPDDPVELS